MGNTGEDPDTMLVKKKSKKSLEENGDLQKKGNKKRKRDSSSETTKIKEKDDEPAVEKDCHPKQKKEKKKKKHKQRHLENEESPDEVKNKKKKKKSRENNSAEENSELQKKDKKKKKKKSLEENGDSQKKGNMKRKRDSSSETTKIKEKDDEPAVEKDCHPKQKKEKKKKKHKQQQLENEESPDEVKNKKKKKKSIENNSAEENSELQKKDKKRKKKKNLDTEITEESADKVKKKKKKKKVSFADEVEIFPPSEKSESVKKKTEGDNLIRGKRFTPEEDEIVKEAVKNYIIVNNLGDEGLNMVLHCKLHKGLRKCWKDIATCIPYRPHTAVYYRAHILFEGGEYGKWTEEEIEFLKESYKKHGNNWKIIAEELGKHRFHVKDTWRRISMETVKSGKWSREEYQGLYDLVNLDLKMKLTQEKQSKHGMLRDNIPWGSISEKLTTRTNVGCCVKWYQQLTSSLVAEKKWCDADDYWLIGALYDVDAACVEDVDWDSLLEHRDGEVCRKRWYQMVRCIEDRKGMPFQQQVDILAKRYHPEMAEIRQDWDDKPRVP